MTHQFSFVRRITFSSLRRLNSFFVKNTLQTFKMKISNQNLSCYIFETNTEEEFRKWWTKIKWHRDNKKKFIKKQHRIHWNSTKLIHQWQQYFENAAMSNDIFKIICRKCNKIMIHSTLNVDNSDMIEHLKSKKCNKMTTEFDMNELSAKNNYRAEMKRLS